MLIHWKIRHMENVIYIIGMGLSSSLVLQCTGPIKMITPACTLIGLMDIENLRWAQMR